MAGFALAKATKHMKPTFECEHEEDGRWIAEVTQIPGVLAYGKSLEAAVAMAETTPLSVLAEPLALRDYH